MFLAAAAFSIASALSAQATPQQSAARSSDTTYVVLDDLVRTAIGQNLRLRAIAAETQAVSTYSSATRSRYDPVLNIGGQSDGNGVGGQLVGLLPSGASYLLGSVAPSTLPGEPIYPNAIVASVNQPVLRGLGFLGAQNAIRAVDAGVAAARARFQRAMDEVTARVGVAYALLVETQRQEASARRSLQRAEELRSAYAELRAMSKITEVDLLTAQLGVASRTSTLLEARRSRQNAEDALVFTVYGARAGTVLARGETVFVPRDTAVALPAVPPIEDAIARALTSRPDVVAARREADRSGYQSRYARNSLLPTLNVSAAFTSTKNDAGSIAAGGDSRFQEWSAGFVLSRPILNTGASAERDRAAAVEMQANAELVDAENTVRAEVRAAYRDLDLGRAQAALAVEASQLARKQYDGERERLNLGLTDIFRVLQFEEQAARVERAEADAWYGYSVAVVRYRLAVADR